MSQPLTYWSNRFGRNVPHETIFEFKFTGAGALAKIVAGQPGYFFTAAATQALIDAELGSTNEILAVKFDGTTMGVDAFGGVVNFDGQIEQLVSVEVSYLKLSNATHDTAQVFPIIVACPDTGLTDSTLGVEATKTSAGNLGFHSVLLGLDAATEGLVQLRVKWISK